MRHIVINGSTGFIGTHLVKELLKREFKVTSLVRDKSKIPWVSFWRQKIQPI